MSGLRLVLILDDELGSLAEITMRLVRLRIDTIHAKASDEAILLAKQEIERIEAVLVSPAADGSALAQLLRVLGTRARGAPKAVVIGRRPAPGLRDRLAKAGASMGIWEPLSDSTLRYVVSSLLTLPEERSRRKRERVPTMLLGAAHMGATRRDVVVYTLSTGGAFLETPRPFLADSLISLELNLPEGPLRSRARVVYANGVDDVERPHVPLGMAVAFSALAPADEARIAAFVSAREAEFLL